jgi:hypothetical protein
MGSHFAALQAKILKQPERYVQTYQVFSESPSGGLYRVTGQVTVAMDALKNDIQQLGLTPAQAPAPQPAAPAVAPARRKPRRSISSMNLWLILKASSGRPVSAVRTPPGGRRASEVAKPQGGLNASAHPFHNAHPPEAAGIVRHTGNSRFRRSITQGLTVGVSTDIVIH